MNDKREDRVFDPMTVIDEFLRCKLREYSIDFGKHNADFNVLKEAEDYEFGLFYFRKTG